MDSPRTVHLVGQRTLMPGVFLTGKVSFSFWKIPSLRGEYLMSFVISRVVSSAFLISVYCFNVSAAVKLRAWP